MKYKEFIITFTEFPLKHIKHIFFGRWNFEFKTKRNWDFLGKKGIFNLRFNIRVISLYPHSILDHFLGSIAKIKFFKIQNRKNGGNPKNGESNSFLKNLYYLKARNQLQNKCVFPKIFPQSIFIIFIIGGAILINNSTKKNMTSYDSYTPKKSSIAQRNLKPLCTCNFMQKNNLHKT